MQSCQISNDLPNDVLKLIYLFVDSKSKTNFSAVNRAFSEIGKAFAESIWIFPPPPFCGHKAVIPNNILVELIQKYPNVKRLSIGGFGRDEENYFLTLIGYIANQVAHGKPHPLSHIKKMEFREKYRDSQPKKKKDEAKKLDQLFFSSLSHSNLESVSITAFQDSEIKGTDVQPILDKSLQLKKFEVDWLILKELDISFKNQSQLISAKFYGFKGPIRTLESLKTCTKLQTLVLDNCRFLVGSHHSGIKQLLINNNWKLKRLEAVTIEIETDYELKQITEKLSQLEHFHIGLSYNITEDGLETLGVNCPNLRTFRFKYNGTNDGIYRLTKHLSKLEKLSLEPRDQLFCKNFLTGEGVASIAQNCPKLQVLIMNNLKSLERNGIEALVKNCLELKDIQILDCGTIHEPQVAFDDLEYLAKKTTKLIRFHSRYTEEMSKEDIEDLEKKFPHVFFVTFFKNDFNFIDYRRNYWTAK